jgi:hypothetical protein
MALKTNRPRSISSRSPISLCHIDLMASTGLKRRFWSITFGLSGGLFGLHGEDAMPVVPNFTSVNWLESARPILAKASVTDEGVTLASTGTGSHIGDTTTILVQAVEGTRIRQWAVTLSINEIKPEERQLRSPAFALYLSNGKKVVFDAKPFEGMSIHVLGPFSNFEGAGGAENIWSGTLVNPQYLGLGLDGAAAFWIRVNNTIAKDPDLRASHFSLGISSNPFPPEQTAKGRILSDRLAITTNEGRAYAGFLVALLNFFQIASQTPGVREIIFEALDVPWWSIATHGGHITDTGFELIKPVEQLSPAEWSLPPNMDVYSIKLVLRIQGKPALNCRLALTAPQVPLLNTAGIVGIAAMRPDGKGPHLMIRLMAGRPAMASTGN